MSEYLVVADRATALSKSRQEALRRGCGPVTQWWWALVNNPNDATVAITLTSADDKVGLSAAEKVATIDKATMDAAGWFPPGKLPGKLP